MKTEIEAAAAASQTSPQSWNANHKFKIYTFSYYVILLFLTSPASQILGLKIWDRLL